MVSSYGNDGFILTSLKPETSYYAIAVGIGPDGMTTTDVVYEKFETPAKEVSANSISISVEDITATTALVKTEVTNDDHYILTLEPANIIKGMTDAGGNECVVGAVVVSSGISILIPADLTPGDYVVYLQQGGARWVISSLFSVYAGGAMLRLSWEIDRREPVTLTEYLVEGSEETAQAYDRGNLTSFRNTGFSYDASGMANHPSAPDVVWAYMSLMEQNDPFVYIPYLLGWYTKSSVYLPTSMVLPSPNGTEL